MKNRLYHLLAATLCCTFISLNMHAQAVAPGSNVPATPPAAPPDVNTYPDLPNYISATKYNYIRTYIPDQPATSTTGTLYHRKVTDYFDGLGRPLQTVNERGHADGFDIVQTHTYDNAGRETYQYLPYATNIDHIYTNGNFHPNVHADIHNFFYVNQGDEPYAKTEYDNSPLNRVVKQLNPGHSWVGSNRGKEYQYTTNVTKGFVSQSAIPVHLKFTNVYPLYTINAAGTAPVYSGGYADNQLYITQTTNEDGQIEEAVKDKLGRLVMKRILKNNTVATSFLTYPSIHPQDIPTNFSYTIYVYDDLDRLRFVLSPQACSFSIVPTTSGSNLTYNTLFASPSANTLSGLCFQYQYDTRGRLMAKQEPGKAVEYYVYDKRDRPVFYQDGNLRAQGKWQFTIYDALDRPVVTGVMPSATSTQASLTSGINSTASYAAPSIWHYVKDYNLWHSYPASVTTGSGSSQLLSYTYYDDYANIPPTGYGYSNQFPTVSQPYLVQPAKSNNTKGLVTQTKSRVLGAPVETWITAVNYYDDKGRLIQTISDNLDGGLDTVSNAYYFQGMLWKTITKHNNPNARHIPNASDELKNIVMEDTYDRNISTGGGNDLVWARHQKLNDGIDYELAYYDYNESGQVKNKQLTVTNVTQGYNITGWLTSIDASYHNLGDATQDKQFFHENLYYDKGFASKLYNGNIAGITWSKYTTAGVFAPQNAYGYSYDMLNRLKQAEYRYQSAAAGAWSKAVKDYTVSNITYDLNGNLKSMNQRNPGTGSPIDMDKLTYTYTANSNQLLKVKDDITPTATTGLPDFKDNNDPATEYKYDENGNLTMDENKKITSITYNYLNKPSQITVQAQGSINYYYDAAGNRLRKIVSPLTGDKDTFDYIGNFVYKNQVLQYILNEEGRARPVYSSELDATKFVYDYFIKDHLGNVQSTLTAEPAAAMYLASCEIAAANIEQLLFDNIPAVREDKPGGGGDDTKAAELIATDSTRRIGPAIMFKAMPGDQLSFSVKSYYDDNHTDPKNTVSGSQVIGSLLTTLMGGVNYDGVPVEQIPGSVRTVQQTLGNTADVANAINQIPVTNQDDGAPRAYLNVLVFDAKTFKLLPGLSQRIQVPLGGGTWHDFTPVQLGGEFHPLPGSVLVIAYVNNETIGNNVWFDDLDISHYSGGVLEDNFYYPFGLTISDDAQPANTDQPVKFQSQQHEDDFGINIYSFKWREHDPTIGRFWQHDPLASKYVYNSPYAFSGNRVVNAVELEGLEPVFIGSDILIGDDALMKLGTEESTTESLIPKTTPVPVNAPTPAQVSLGDAIQVGIDFARATNEIFDKVSDNVQQAVDNVKDAFEKGKNDATKTSPVKNRVKLRKGTIRQIDENQPKNEHGEPIDPNDKKPLGDDKTDIGHKPGNEWRRRQVMHQEKGSSRREVIEEENNPDLYQRERSSNNRSHRYEQKD